MIDFYRCSNFCLRKNWERDLKYTSNLKQRWMLWLRCRLLVWIQQSNSASGRHLCWCKRWALWFLPIGWNLLNYIEHHYTGSLPLKNGFLELQVVAVTKSWECLFLWEEFHSQFLECKPKFSLSWLGEWKCVARSMSLYMYLFCSILTFFTHCALQW